MQSSKNNHRKANFSVGFLYHEGKYINGDIRESIRLYKEASSFNIEYAKNNLGIIHKNGIENEIPKNIANAKVYFKEAIKQKSDKVSMYNLSHIYIYDQQTDKSIEKSIQLLIESSNLDFYPSKILLCLILIKKYGAGIVDIEKGLSSYIKVKSSLIELFKHIIVSRKLYMKKHFEEEFQNQKFIDYLYNQSFDIIVSSDLKKKEDVKEPEIDPNRKNITKDFYEGFGDF